MVPLRYMPLVFKYIARYRTRSILTITGVATAMFLFCSVQAMREGVREATERDAHDTTLVVYRQDRYCPYTSNLPQDYRRRIRTVPGVKAVVPVKILINNCRTSLDVVAFRGVPADAFDIGMFDHMRLREGSLEAWKRRTDAILVGERLARRRNLRVGDRLELAGIRVWVAGVLESTEPQDRNVAYAHLEFVQRSGKGQIGTVTQFNVQVNDPAQMDAVSRSIDEMFRRAQEPTSTWSEKAFVGRAASDIVEIVRFAQWLGWGCIVTVLALVGNSIVLSTRERTRDYAVMQTLGYSPRLIGRLVIAEGLLLSLSGSLTGLVAGLAVTAWGSFSLSVEGLSIHIHTSADSIVLGLGLAASVGVLAGLVPAWRAARSNPVECFRAV